MSCPECKKDRANSLFLRFFFENQYHEKSTFWTFTYSDEFLPKNHLNIPTLRQRDFTLFIKRLRKLLSQYNKKFKYFYVGEYGGQTNRPHYHALLFGISSDLYKVVNDKWSYGFTTVSTVNPRRFRYVSEYITKNEVFSRDFCISHCIEPQFSCSSKKPAIGLEWIQKNYLTVIRNGYINYQGVKYPIPRYFFNKIKELDPYYIYKLGSISFKNLVSQIGYSNLVFYPNFSQTI